MFQIGVELVPELAFNQVLGESLADHIGDILLEQLPVAGGPVPVVPVQALGQLPSLVQSQLGKADLLWA